MIKCNHEDAEKLVKVLREEFSTVMTTVCKAVEMLLDSACPLEHKQWKKATDLYISFIQTHDLIKGEVALHMDDVSKAVNVFSQAQSGSKYSSVITTALKEVMVMN